jgi:hypothetical protein
MTGDELCTWVWICYSYAAVFVVGVMAGIGIAQRMRRFRGYCPWVSEKKCVYLEERDSIGEHVPTDQRPSCEPQHTNHDRDRQSKA